MLLKTQGIKNFLMFCLIKINKTQNEKKKLHRTELEFQIDKDKSLTITIFVMP